MVKIALSQDIEQAAFDRFHAICDLLPLNKNEVLTLMIRVFDALPHQIQDQLCSKRPGVSEHALEKLSLLDSLEAASDGLAATAKQRRNRDDQTQDQSGA